MHLFLIGYRGTGKTTVAHQVAEQIGRPWCDADVEIEAQAGHSIAAIFAAGGEPEFRRREAGLLEQLCARPPHVVALGGGVILAPGNRALLRGAGRTVWLTASPETLWARITADATTAARRPNLTAGGGVAEIRQVLADRLPLYRECADWVVDTEDKSPADVAGEIVALVQRTAPVEPA